MDKKPKIYFAGPWFTDDDEIRMERCISISRNCNNKYDVYFPYKHQYSTPFETYQSNVREINDADIVIALVETKDVGTAYELGIATALKKKIILLGESSKTFLRKTNIMLAFCTDTLTTINELKYIFEGKEYRNIRMENTWEGKE